MRSAREQLERLVELSVPGLLPEFERLDEWALWIEIWVRALRDPALAKEREVLDRRWRQSIADIIRRGRATGSSRTARTPTSSDCSSARLIDGLAIQVLDERHQLSPEAMKRDVHGGRLEADRVLARTRARLDGMPAMSRSR